MDITCPACSTAFEIDDGSVGETGRKVRCSNCTTIWRAFRDGRNELVNSAQLPVIENPPPLAPSQADVAAEPSFPAPADGSSLEMATASDIEIPPDGVPEEPTAPKGARLIKDKTSGRTPSRGLKRFLPSTPVVIILLTLLAGVAIMQQRENVVRLVPQTASVFSAIGFPVNLRGIKISSVKSRMIDDNGVTVLVVDGDLVNVRKERVSIPRLRFAVLGDKGQEIYVWSAQADRPTLQPGESLNFRRRLAAPPADGKEVSVRFLTASDMTSGIK